MQPVDNREGAEVCRALARGERLLKQVAKPRLGGGESAAGPFHQKLFPFFVGEIGGTLFDQILPEVGFALEAFIGPPSGQRQEHLGLLNIV